MHFFNIFSVNCFRIPKVRWLHRDWQSGANFPPEYIHLTDPNSLFSLYNVTDHWVVKFNQAERQHTCWQSGQVHQENKSNSTLHYSQKHLWKTNQEWQYAFKNRSILKPSKLHSKQTNKQVWFYGSSTIVGHLMLNLFYTCIKYDFKEVPVV